MADRGRVPYVSGSGRRAWALVVVLLLLPGLNPSESRADEGGTVLAVDAGSLRAVVSTDPWGLEFVAADGATVLSESTGTGTGPTGTLGFRTPTGWRHATRVVSHERHHGAYQAELATTDPFRRIHVRLATESEGVISLDAEVVGTTTADVRALGMGFEAEPTERYLGFGERSNAIDQRGRMLENYVGEGVFPTEERPFLQAIVPHWGMQPRDDATYFPIPWLLSTAGYGVLVDNLETSYFRLGTDDADAWSVEVVGAPPNQPTGLDAPAPDRLSLRVFAGPQPADVLERFTDATGRQPEAAAPWYYGPWMQPVGGGHRGRVDQLRAADVPVSVAQTFVRYLPCGGHREHRAQQRKRTTALHRAGVAATTYANPMICRSFEEPYEQAAAGDGLARNRLDDPYVYRYPNWPHFATQQDLRHLEVSQFDLTSPVGRSVLTGLLWEIVEDGYDGWMQDYGEYTPLDATSADGTHGSRMHNLYPVLYHCTARELAADSPRPLGRFIRSGFTGVAPCAEIVWGGDPTTDWGFDGLESAIYNGLTMGLSGISIWGSDIGGLFANGLNRLSPELKIRWIQFGLVSGVMRDQAGQFAVPDTEDKARPQIWDPQILPHWRRSAKMRTQLYPYLLAAEQEYQRSGMPLMRHHALTHPEDPEAVARDTQFMFGPDLLAAPILEPGQRQRTVYLPDGEWLDAWSSLRYDELTGGLHLRDAHPLPGARQRTVDAPLEELPLFIRAGAILPMLPPDVDTLADYGEAGIVRLSDRQDQLRLLAFPRGDSESRFGNSGRIASSEEHRGHHRWSLVIEDDVHRTYHVEATLATLYQPFDACKVTLDGEAVPSEDWDFDPDTSVVTIQVGLTAGELEVRSCPTRPARHSPPGR